MLKSELEYRVKELEAELSKGSGKHKEALEEIKRLGGRQGSIAAEALKG